MEKIQIYCDGACSGNQFGKNSGGWGAILKYKDKVKKLYGAERNTSNQRMELTACIKALEAIKINSINIDIYSDSAYLINCMNEKWYERWEKNNWRNSKNKPVENQDLWVGLITLIRKYDISFHKVDGHKGVDLNELADKLARIGIEESNNCTR
jgi:ribonuclease HI